MTVQRWNIILGSGQPGRTCRHLMPPTATVGGRGPRRRCLSWGRVGEETKDSLEAQGPPDEVWGVGSGEREREGER